MAHPDDIHAVRESGLFDLAWFRERCPGAPGEEAAAVAHFLDNGMALGLDPGPGFSMRRYLQRNPDVAAAGMNPLLHYLAHGRREGRMALPVDEQGVDDAGSGVATPEPPAPRTLERWTCELASLRGSRLFDPDFYLDRNPDVCAANLDPLRHFVEHGAGEGRWPNPWFDPSWYRAREQPRGDESNPLFHYAHSPGNAHCWTSEWFDGNYYRHRYPDAAASSLTPLEHFLLHGVDTGRETREASRSTARGRVPDPAGIRTTVVVTVHNAASQLKACLDSVARHTPLGSGDSLLVIDDASDDPAVIDMLDRLDGMPNVRIVRNQRNIGYTASANLACRLSGEDDVVLLNSDTEVGPHWLRNMKIAAYRRQWIGTVTAVSDNAGAFSVPREGSNALGGVSPNAWARVVADAGAPDFEVPTGNGFCMYLRRSMLEDVGDFDEESFPTGYGEENDLCMRAILAGWHHLVCPTVFVHHQGSASFGERRAALAASGMERLVEKHPGYPAAIAGFADLRGFIIARYLVARRLRALGGSPAPLPRVLFVLSTDNGGIPHSNADLVQALAGAYDCLVLRSDSRTVQVLRPGGDGNLEVVERHPLSEPIGFGIHVGEEYEAVVRDVILRYSIDLLHVRHLAWHSLNLVGVAHGMDVPVVISIHDFYAVCPSVNLVDREGVLHPRGIVGAGENALWPHDAAARLPVNESMLAAWQRRMEAVLLSADALVASSPSARALLIEALPALAHGNIQLIPHGRDFRGFRQLQGVTEPSPDAPLRILLLGNIGIHKGSGLVEQVLQQAAPGTLEFHLLGTCDPGLRKWVVDHGPYVRDELAGPVETIRPHLAAIFSLASETWCHTLTESWALGLPVVAIDRGAVGDRVREHGGGWLVHPDARSIHALLLDIRRDPPQWRARVREVRKWRTTVGAENGTLPMGEAYASVYREAMTGARSRGFRDA